MLRTAIYILFVIFLTIPGRIEGAKYSEKLLNKAKKIADKSWVEDQVKNIPMEINLASDYYSPYDTVFRLANESNQNLGFLVVSSAKGRFDRFDFMTVYSVNFKLLDISILAYRSEYGSQICSKSWLKQFYGTSTDQDLQYGSDIDALSGATLSAKSLTDEVNRLSKMMNELPDTN